MALAFILSGLLLCAVAGILAWRNTRMLHRANVAHRQAESELRTAYTSLTEVKERTAELSKVNETLKAEAAEHKRVEAERVKLLKRLVKAQEEERRRISRELHDQLGQYLSAMMLRLKAMRLGAAGREPSEDALHQLEELTGMLIEEVHHLAWEFRPAALDDLGLQAALHNYADKWSERSGVVVDFHTGGLERQRLPVEVETTIYRIVQEALTNVLKHAEAHRVSVAVERRREHVIVIIDDDGRGFDVARAHGSARGLGLLGMEERVALVGGALDLESGPGGGVTVRARIPIPAYTEKEDFPREYFANRLGR